jgi:ribulose-phosphate 3-epimerase
VKNVRAIVAAGADTLVAGSAIFGANDRAAEIARLRHEAKYGRQVQA